MPVIILIVISTRFSIEVWGELTLVQAIAAFSLIVINFGSDSYGIREMSKNKGVIYNDNLVFNTFLLRLIVFVIVAICSIYPLIIQFERLAYFTLALSFLNCLSPFWIFVGLKQLRSVVLFEFMVRFIALILMILYVKDDDYIGEYCIILISVPLFINIYSWLQYFRQRSLSGFASIKIDVLSLYKNLMPFLSFQVLQQAFIGLPVLVVGFRLGYTYSAIYGNAEKIQRIVRGLISPIGRVLLSYSSDFSYRSNRMSYIKLIAMTSFFLMIGAIIITNIAVTKFFGQEYSEMVHLSSILLASVPFIYVSSILVNLEILPNGMEKALSRILFWVAAITSITLLFGIDYFGVLGVAVVVGLAELSLLLCLVRKIYKYEEIV